MEITSNTNLRFQTEKLTKNKNKTRTPNLMSCNETSSRKITYSPFDVWRHERDTLPRCPTTTGFRWVASITYRLEGSRDICVTIHRHLRLNCARLRCHMALCIWRIRCSTLSPRTFNSLPGTMKLARVYYSLHMVI